MIIPRGVIIIDNKHLILEVITVILGVNNTVIWINQDDTGHGIALDNGGGSVDFWGSPGTYEYHILGRQAR